MSDQKTKNKEAFDQFDEERKGSLPIAELPNVLRSLNLCPTEAEMADIVKAAGGGDFNIDTLNTAVDGYLPNQPSMEDTIEAFKVFDKDGKGMIDEPGLRHILTQLGEKFTNEEADLCMKELDESKQDNGDIDYKKFVEIMMK